MDGAVTTLAAPAAVEPANGARAASTAVLEALRGSVADPTRVTSRAIDRYALAHDASHFLLIPQAVVVAEDAEEVGRLMRSSAAQGVPLTFRSGGTSLSGQAITDGILVDVRRNFTRVEVLDGGARVRVQPGVTVRALNTRLARFGRKFGPDPASEIACTIGGVIANNSSGMACGTVDNAYQTLESLLIVLPSGTVIDTAEVDADARLRALEPVLHAGLVRLAARVQQNAASVALIRHQFSMKNTMGYGLNSFLDFERPVDMLAHLIVGSEGTLGFVAEAVFRTVPLKKFAATALLVFDNLLAANSALPALVDTGAATVELMDALSLQVGQSGADAPSQLRDLRIDKHAALLLEYQGESAAELEQFTTAGTGLLARLPLDSATALSTDATARAALWHLRKGLYATVAGARPPGTVALLEDVVVPVDALAGTCESLIGLFGTYSYENSVIFGHAKDGNVHFMLTDTFVGEKSLSRFGAFTEDLVELVLGAGGSLKAEHGTGRVMAPFVRRQYGDELYEVMREVKTLCDPGGLLNPGVLLSDDPKAHVTSIKSSPPVEAEVDTCVECGYCEPVCPSRNVTLTPRQRIVTRRAIAQAELDGDSALVAELEKDSVYESVQTCAVDGMCQTACPVLINTGSLVKRLREQDNNRIEKALWAQAATHWGVVTRGAAAALSVVDRVPIGLLAAPNAAARAVLGTDRVPLYSEELPRGGASRRRPAPASAPDAVYLPACVGTMFGPADGSPGIQASFEELCERAGITLLVPTEIDGLCCGTPWSSKGLAGGGSRMQERTVAALLTATRGGELPVVCDASSCTEGLLQSIAATPSGTALTIVDAVEFVATRVLSGLPPHERIASLSLHPTCSSTRLGTNGHLAEVAAEVAESVRVPEDWGCCAFAGDRGMLHPELTESATRVQAQQVRDADSEAHASCNRTCELGMTRATGREYQHVLELLAAATRPGVHPAL